MQTNIELSKNEHTKIQQSYKDQFVGGKYGLPPIIKKTNLDVFQEQHSMKLTHVLIIAGITFIFLSNYQNGQAPFSDFVTSA